MKGKLLLLFCLMFPFFLFSQVHIGISGGGGLDNMVSLRASIPVEIALSKSLSLQPAFVFTQQHIPALYFAGLSAGNRSLHRSAAGIQSAHSF